MESSTSSIATSDAAVWAADRAAVDGALEAASDRAGTLVPARVADAVRYGLLGGGKRFRALLVLAAYRTAGGGAARELVAPLAAAIEIVHAYSLIHDDLPCMDDDEMRRGRPTVHRVFGVEGATAAGVAMVPLAALEAYEAGVRLGLAPSASAEIVRELMRASGAGGMIGGQLLDLEGEGRPLGLADLERIHRAKTGALISVSVVAGGLAARAHDAAVTALRRFGDAIGLAFQIADDVLDVTSTTDALGKTAGRDVALGKSTYPAVLGVDGARARAHALVASASAALRDGGLASAALDALARLVVERES